MKPLTNQTRSALLWSTGGGLLSNFIQIGFVAVLARLLAPSDFGIYAAAQIFVSFLQIIAEAGVGPALIQRKDLTPLHIRTAALLSTALFCVIAAALMLLAPLCARIFDIPQLTGAIRVLALWLPMRGISIVPESLLLRDMRFDVYAKTQLLTYVVGFGLVSVGLAFAGAGHWALLLGNFSQMALYAMAVAFFYRRDFRLGFGRAEARELLHYGFGNTLALMTAFFADQGSHMVTARLLGPVPLGLFSRAYQLLVSPAKMVGNTVSKAIFPALSKIQDQPGKMAAILRGGLSITGIVTIPMSVVAILFAREIVDVLLGASWREVVPAFRVLVVSLVFRSGYRLFDTAAKAVGAVYQRAWRGAIYAAAVIGFALLGCRHGLDAVAWGNTAAITLNFLMMQQLCCRRLEAGIWSMLRSLRGGLVIGAGVALCEWPVVLVAARRPDLPAALILAVAMMVALFSFLLLWSRTAPWLLGGDGAAMLARMIPPRLHRRFRLPESAPRHTQTGLPT